MSKHFAIFFSALATIACADADGSPAVVLGAIIDSTSASSETSWVSAAQQAVANMNKALSTAASDHPRFAIDVRDSQGSALGVGPIAAELVRDSGVVAILVDTNDGIDAALDQLTRDGTAVPLQCSACLNDEFNTLGAGIPDPQGFRFRNVDGILPLAYVMASSLRTDGGDRNNDGLLKISVYTGNNASDDEAFRDLTTAAGVIFQENQAASSLVLERVTHRDTDPSRIDYVADIVDLLDNATASLQGQTLIDGPPDWIVVATSPAVHIRFVEAYDAAPSNVPVRHMQNLRRTATLFALDALADGQQGVSPISADGVSGEEFAKDFARDIGYEPAVFAASFYDNAVSLMFAQLIAEMAGDPSATGLRDALPKTSTIGAARFTASIASLTDAVQTILDGGAIDYMGASGPVDYDPQRGARSIVARYIVDRDRFSETQLVDCVAPGACGR
ncbi:MAG: hypothetical protein H7Z43_04755 [Clostridia bacterium]|nr:hypothetical protein [Deltaproteobacteria bacterium]